MTAREQSPRLGRGLAALLGESSAPTRGGGESVRALPLDLLEPGPFQPRSTVDEPALAELAESMRTRGILQPLIARIHPTSPGRFQIIAGERRWRAAQRAGLHEVPVVIIEATDAESLQIAIIENVQRADLNPLEEADGYRALMDEFGNSQDEIAKTVGKSRSHVANTLRLLKLPETVKGYIHAGKLSAGHARMLVGQPNAEELAEEIVARGLNVRQVEAMAREVAQKGAKGQTNGRKANERAEKNANLLALEKRISDALGLAVSIDDRERGGVLSIRYRNLDQLDEVLRRLEKKPS